MVQLFAFRRTLVACVTAMVSIVVVASLSPAEARPRHRGHHAGQSSHHHHSLNKRSLHKHKMSRRHVGARKSQQRLEQISLAVEQRRAARLQRFFNAQAALIPHPPMLPQDGVSVQTNQASTASTSHPSFANSLSMGKRAALSVVAEARRYLGGNPTGRKSLWCARFMNMVLQRSGHRTTGSDMARSFASYGERVSGPRIGAIAVMSRGRRGGHVGIVSGVDAKGNPIVVSGNHGHRVAESVYARSRIYAYVMPN